MDFVGVSNSRISRLVSAVEEASKGSGETYAGRPLPAAPEIEEEDPRGSCIGYLRVEKRMRFDTGIRNACPGVTVTEDGRAKVTLVGFDTMTADQAELFAVALLEAAGACRQWIGDE